MKKFFTLILSSLIFTSVNSAEISDPFDDGEEYEKTVNTQNRYVDAKLHYYDSCFSSESYKWTKFETKILPYFLNFRLIELVEFLQKNKNQKNKECRNVLFEIYVKFYCLDKNEYFDCWERF